MRDWLILLSLFIFGIPCGAHSGESDPFKFAAENPHQVKLLNHGLSSFEERLEMVERAKTSIDVEYFIYNLDKSGRIFSQALIQKAREGVKVRMLLDYFMVKSQFSPFFAYEMEKNGIEVKYFNTTSTLNLLSGQYRNHRKVLLIDGKEALTGGRNIGDEYFDLRSDFNFLDRDIEIKGDIVNAIQETFDQVWDSKLSRKVSREKIPEITDGIYNQGKAGGGDTFRYQLDLKNWNEKVAKAVEFLSVSDKTFLDEVRAKGKIELASEYQGTCENMGFNSEYPIVGRRNRAERIIKHDIANRIKNARESILFDSPYFIVDDEAKEALDLALSNKVNVTLLTNSLNSTDAVYVYAAFNSIIKEWLEKGLDPYIYKGSLPENYPTLNDDISHARFGVHAKSFVFDHKDVVIGTFNFDPRSANFNAEMTVSCDNNPELAKVVTEDIEGRIKNSIQLDSGKTVDDVEFYNVSLLKKIEYFALKIPSNLIDFLL